MDFDTLSSRLIETTKNDFVNGSITIAKNTIRGIIEILEIAYPSDTKKLFSLISELKRAKPAMSALQNVLNRTEPLLTSGDRWSMIFQLNMLLDSLEKSTQDTINVAIEHITLNLTPPYRITTASLSSTFIKFVTELNQIESTEVFCLESKWAERDYSVLLTEKLAQLGVDAKILPLSSINSIANSSFAMIGTDCVCPEGVVNGAPSRILAIHCKTTNLPLFVLAESIKYSNKCTPDSGFDFIDSSLITKIFSDKIF